MNVPIASELSGFSAQTATETAMVMSFKIARHSVTTK